MKTVLSLIAFSMLTTAAFAGGGYSEPPPPPPPINGLQSQLDSNFKSNLPADLRFNGGTCQVRLNNGSYVDTAEANCINSGVAKSN